MYVNQVLLHVTKNTVKNAKANVIITHGIAEHSGRYEKMAKILNEHQYNCIRYDLRGHGQSAGPRGKLKSYKIFIEDLHEIVKEVKDDQLPVYLLGHSLGGLITHIYAVTYQDVEGIITSGATTDFVKDVLPLRIFGPKLLSWFAVKTNFADDKLSRIPSVERAYIDDPLNLKKMYGSLIGQSLVNGVRYLKKQLDQHNVPTLLMHGGNDKIVPHYMSEAMYLSIKHEDKTLKIYEDAYHEIFNDIDQDLCYNDVTFWLDERTKKTET